MSNPYASPKLQVVIPAIVTQGLSVRYGSLRALESLDLEVARGTLFALLGPNGAGKSSTIAVLTTLRAPSAGRASVAGWDVTERPRDVRASIGVVFQEVSLDDRLTARENLDLFAAMYGIDRRTRAARIAAQLASVGLSATAGQRVRTFSGGMKRRLEIARALLHEPAVVVLDEPTVGLDPQTRRSVWEQLASIARAQGRTVFVTTHYMDEAERCDDVAVIDHGKLIARGSPAELMARAGGERVVIECADRARVEDYAREHGWKVRADGASLAVEGERPEVVLARLADLGAGLREARIVRPKLEDAFVALTGKQLRDVHDEDAGRHAAMGTNLRARGRR